jgi:hypothetical protein
VAENVAADNNGEENMLASDDSDIQVAGRPLADEPTLLAVIQAFDARNRALTLRIDALEAEVRQLRLQLPLPQPPSPPRPQPPQQPPGIFADPAPSSF